MTDVPLKYQPDKRQWEKRAWLYEQYWGEMRSTKQMADDVSVSNSEIRREMERQGIPRRPVGRPSERGGGSPFRGFYNGDESAPNPSVDDPYDGDFEDRAGTYTWEKVAAKEDALLQDWDPS